MICCPVCETVPELTFESAFQVQHYCRCGRLCFCEQGYEPPKFVLWTLRTGPVDGDGNEILLQLREGGIWLSALDQSGWTRVPSADVPATVEYLLDLAVAGSVLFS